MWPTASAAVARQDALSVRQLQLERQLQLVAVEERWSAEERILHQVHPRREGGRERHQQQQGMAETECNISEQLIHCLWTFGGSASLFY